MLSLPGLLDEGQLTGMARAGEEKSNSLVSKERRPEGLRPPYQVSSGKGSMLVITQIFLVR